MRDVQRRAGAEVVRHEVLEPVVGEEDLAFAAALADDAEGAAGKVDVGAAQAHDLVDAHAGGQHQGDREERRGLVRAAQQAGVVDRGVVAQRAQQAVEVGRGHEPRQLAGSPDRDGHSRPWIGVQQAAVEEPRAEAAQAAGAAPQRRARQPERPLVLDEGDEHVTVDRRHTRLTTDVALEGGEVAVVGADRVR
jgi:hypothetical protein